VFAEDGQIKILNGARSANLAPYQSGKWYELGLKVDVATGRFDVSLDGQPVASSLAFAEYVKSVERISFRTGARRDTPNFKTSTDRTPDRLSPNPDVPEPLTIYHIDEVTITPSDIVASSARSK
jgi:hypothetical protein